QLQGRLDHTVVRRRRYKNLVAVKLGFQRQPASHRRVPRVDVSPETTGARRWIAPSIPKALVGQIEVHSRKAQAADRHVFVDRHYGIDDLLADHFGKTVRVLRLRRMAFVKRQIIGRPEIFGIDEPKGRRARRDDDLFHAQVGRGPQYVIRRRHVVSKGLGIGREIGRLISTEMHDPVGAFERLEEIAGVTQVSQPAWTELFSRRNPIEAKHLILVRKQIANDKLPQPPTSSGNHDFFHSDLFCPNLFRERFTSPRSPSLILPRAGEERGGDKNCQRLTHRIIFSESRYPLISLSATGSVHTGRQKSWLWSVRLWARPPSRPSWLPLSTRDRAAF